MSRLTSRPRRCVAPPPPSIHPDLQRNIELVIRDAFTGEIACRTGIRVSPLEAECMRGQTGVESYFVIGFDPAAEADVPAGWFWSEHHSCWVICREPVATEGGAA